MKISLNKGILYSLLLCVISLPFSNAFVNIFFVIFLILKSIDLFKNKSFLNINTNTLLFIILVIYLVFNAIIQGSFSANRTLWKFAPILLLGSYFISDLSDRFLHIFRNTSIIACLAYVLFVISRITIFYFENDYLPFGNGEEVNQLLIIERPYLGFLIVLNIIFAFNNIIKNKFRTINYSIIFGLTLFLITISARLSVLSVIIISSIYFLFFNKLNYKRKAIILVSFISFIITLTIFNPKFTERINHFSYEELINYEPRFIIWKSVVNITNNEDFNPLIGYGNYNLIEEYLVLNYEEEINSNSSKRQYYIDERFNTHSQYLDYFLFGGIPAVLVFSIFCLYSLWSTKQDFTNFTIILAFVLFFAVENVFHRQLGCYLFVLYFILSIKNNKTKYKQIEEK